MLNQWFGANKLSLNVKKTKYIIFKPSIGSQNRVVNNQLLTINNQPIERISNTSDNKSFKFLGIHVDENITWKHHINYICTKISRSNYIINKVKRIIPVSCLQTLYHSIIQCHLNYGIQTWGSSNQLNRVYKCDIPWCIYSSRGNPLSFGKYAPLGHIRMWHVRLSW